ncbi:MAG TPA: ERAP1-like C-terminal domain-containing protein, partial [Burkholderiaceae bacterium]
KDGRTTVALTQEEFTKDRPGKQPLRWRVPVIAQVAGKAPVRTIVEGGSASMTLPGCGPVVVNAGQSAYFRTLYESGNIGALSGGFKALPDIDQLGILADTWALGMSGAQPVTDALALADKLDLNAAPHVWTRVAGMLNTLDTLYKVDPARQQRFRQFAVARLQPKLAQLGWEGKQGELDIVATLRSNLIATLGEMGEPGVVAEARRRYAASIASGKALPASERKTVMSIVARHADKAQWDALRAQAQLEKTPLIRDGLYQLLARAKDPGLAKAALDLALTDEPGATIGSEMITAVAASHPDMTFDFALAHTEQVHAKVDNASRSRYIPGLANASSDPAIFDKLQRYAEQYLAPTSRRSVDTAVGNIRYRMQVQSERLPAIDAWLQRSMPN